MPGNRRRNRARRGARRNNGERFDRVGGVKKGISETTIRVQKPVQHGLEQGLVFHRHRSRAQFFVFRVGKGKVFLIPDP